MNEILEIMKESPSFSLSVGIVSIICVWHGAMLYKKISDLQTSFQAMNTSMSTNMVTRDYLTITILQLQRDMDERYVVRRPIRGLPAQGADRRGSNDEDGA